MPLLTVMPYNHNSVYLVDFAAGFRRGVICCQHSQWKACSHHQVIGSAGNSSHGVRRVFVISHYHQW